MGEPSVGGCCLAPRANQAFCQGLASPCSSPFLSQAGALSGGRLLGGEGNIGRGVRCRVRQGRASRRGGKRRERERGGGGERARPACLVSPPPRRQRPWAGLCVQPRRCTPQRCRRPLQSPGGIALGSLAPAAVPRTVPSIRHKKEGGAGPPPPFPAAPAQHGAPAVPAHPPQGPARNVTGGSQAGGGRVVGRAGLGPGGGRLFPAFGRDAVFFCAWRYGRRRLAPPWPPHITSPAAGPETSRSF